jgi:hypothetical protein
MMTMQETKPRPMAFDQKTCTKCGETKPFEEFNKDRSTKDGLRSCCKECTREKSRKWREANPERHREKCRKWREANPERHRENCRKWREANVEKDREKCRKWREANPERCRENMRRWREANPDKAYAAAQERRAKQSSRVRRIRRLLGHFEGRDVYLDYIAHAIDKRSDAQGLQWLCSRIDTLVAQRVYGEV